MYAAVLSPGRVDLAADCVVRWLAERVGVTPVVVDEPAGAVTKAQAARQAGRAVAEVEAAMRPGGALAAAVIRQHHLSAFAFSIVSGASLLTVIEATRDGSLTPAVTENGRIDLGHHVSLEFCALHPYPRLPDGDLDLEKMPEGLLAPACFGEQIDVNNPFARAFLARCHGRAVPNDDELAELAAGGS